RSRCPGLRRDRCPHLSQTSAPGLPRSPVLARRDGELGSSPRFGGRRCYDGSNSAGRDGMAIIIIVIIAFHVLMLLLALGVATQLIPAILVSDFLGYVHNTIGITTPPMEKVKTIALIWIGATILIVDGCLFLLVAITRLSSSG